MLNDACAHAMPMPNACLTPGCYKLSLPRRDPRDAGVPTRADRPARNVWRSSQLPLEGPHHQACGGYDCNTLGVKHAFGIGIV